MAFVDFDPGASSIMELYGPQAGHMAYSTDLQDVVATAGDYHQYSAFGPVMLGGKPTVNLVDPFVPVKGQNQFRLFESIGIPAWGPDFTGLFVGWFGEVTLPASMKPDWLWTFTYPDGSSSSGMQPLRPFVTGTLTAIPEPGTLALLITGAFGLLLLA